VANPLHAQPPRELLHSHDDFRWLEPRGVIDLDVGFDDHPVAIHDKGGEDG